MALLQQYLQEAGAAVRAQNGQALGNLLSFKGSPASYKAQVVDAADSSSRLQMLGRQMIPAPFNQIVVNHLECLHAWNNFKYEEAFALQKQAASGMRAKMEEDKDTNWWLPVINAVVLQLRLVAYAADDHTGDDSAANGKEEGKGESEKDRHAKEAAAELTTYFQKMIIARSELHQSKKLGCLYIIVNLFKIYFRINNLRLCTNLVNSVNSQNFPPLEMLPKSETVTYKYYYGRLMVFEEKYRQAEEALEWAFRHCHRLAKSNKRRILEFLVPVKMLLGRLPRAGLLEKYQLLQFKTMSEAIRNGNLKQFVQNIEDNQDFFIRKGIFLIVEKLKTYVYRSLFKKVYLCYQEVGPEGKGHMLPLRGLFSALQLNGVEMDEDELECILANLIYEGYIKGYIAHRRCVVLSKKEPFPPLTAVNP